MKKTTLLFLSLIFSFVLSAQITTGTVTLNGNYTSQIDISSSLVTLTLDGPSNGYLGLGFGVTNMNSNNADCVIYVEGTGGSNPTVRDSSFNGNTSTPTQDSQQDWTITENTVMGSTRHLVATRVLDTGNVDDYVFSDTMTSITLVWSYRLNNFGLAYHGGTRGATTASFTTLSTPDFETPAKFSIYPNPSNNVMNVNISTLADEGLKLEVYDVLGKRVYAQQLNKLSSSINIAKWNSGLYLVRLSSPDQDITLTKRFVKL